MLKPNDILHTQSSSSTTKWNGKYETKSITEVNGKSAEVIDFTEKVTALIQQLHLIEFWFGSIIHEVNMRLFTYWLRTMKRDYFTQGKVGPKYEGVVACSQ